MRFLHASDPHIDSPLRGLDRYEGAPIARLPTATRAALERLVDMAIAERVDFVLFAGDIYDRDWQDFHTGLFFRETMARVGREGHPCVHRAGQPRCAGRDHSPVSPQRGRCLTQSGKTKPTRRFDMQPYKDIDGDSGVAAYEIGQGSITVQFSKGGTYLYNGSAPGAAHVAEMQRLAQAGDGLNAYINKYVRKNYAAKLS